MSSSSRHRFRGALDGGAASGVAATVDPWDPAELLALDPPPAGRSRGPAGQAPPDAADPFARERHELELRVEETYARGLEEGRAQGQAEEADRLRHAIRALDAAAAAFRERQPAWLEALDKNLVALATAVARAIVGRELKGQPDDIASLVQRAVTEFPLEARLRIRLNPADLSAISSPLSGDSVAAGRDVRWIPDPAIAPGGCFVEGPESLVDGRVEKSLEKIYTRLVYG
jgi:flagellar assembly protein FliH